MKLLVKSEDSSREALAAASLKVTEEGDSLRFRRQTPFGQMEWVRKKSELNDIVEETEMEEKELARRSEELQSRIEDRLLIAYQRIRKNARNGLAIVQIERDACGGCFNKIPPQHQLDIRMHKKIIGTFLSARKRP